MGEIVNLRRVRRAKGRGATMAQALENRRRHGAPKAERIRIEQEAVRARLHLDGHKREGSDPSEGSDA